MIRHRPGRTRGVSLIEALVALAVMAIGMLGLVGVQSTLRSNADLARQRSEAVRLAQEKLEERRAFVTLAAATTPYHGYADLADGSTGETGLTTSAGSNASYNRTTTIATLDSSAMPVMPQTAKTITVDVSWSDRTGAAQNVRLTSLLAGIAPDLAATAAVPGEGDQVRRPSGRNRGIPFLAKDIGGGLSGFKPPGASGSVVWVFNNANGLFSICTTTASSTDTLTAANVDTGSCGTARYWLVSGFVRYATTTYPPTLSAADLSNPPISSLQVSVTRTDPTPTDTSTCYTDRSVSGAAETYTSYFCAVQVYVLAGQPVAWTGSLSFGSSSLIETSTTSDNASRYKVCRYADTPESYDTVAQSRVNDNFLLIRAGDGNGTVFNCPGSTLAFQPR